MQTNLWGNSFKIGDLVEMQLAFDVASGIVVDVDTKFPPIKIHWFSGVAWHPSQLSIDTVAGMQVTWQQPDEIELVSRGQQ